MCGIAGILGTGPVAWKLVDALKRLEYRGYDSAGVALQERGRILRLRAPGKLENLTARMQGREFTANSGIAHTRWATHGPANEVNAHPHQAGRVAVVHNGIIENHQSLKRELQGAGVNFATDTDTEVIAQLVDRLWATGVTPAQAVADVLKRLKGAFALAFLFEGEEDLMIGACHGCPLAVGHGDGEVFLGSDAIALAALTNRITYLQDGDRAVLSREKTAIFDDRDQPVERLLHVSQASAVMADKGHYRHFMAKEIAEQPEVVSHTLAAYIDFAAGTLKTPEPPVPWRDLDRLTILACGTAFYAGLVAKYWFERLAGLTVDVDIASEFRYRHPPLGEGGMTLAISQSGETADTLAALRHARAGGHHTAAIVNVAESTIARESDTVWPIYAGPEIGVASTKAFTCQLAVLACLALAAARDRGVLDETTARALVTALGEAPRHLAWLVGKERAIIAVARKLAQARDALYIGRGPSFPIALEGALKLKEISYIHAEGYAGGEMKHGPIALIDEAVPVVVIAPEDALYDKTMSNMQEVAARGARVILISSRPPDENPAPAVDFIAVPQIAGDGGPYGELREWFVSPLLNAIPVQLLAYHAAVLNGTDVDQPRNLAKSVTVE